MSFPLFYGIHYKEAWTGSMCEETNRTMDGELALPTQLQLSEFSPSQNGCGEY